MPDENKEHTEEGKGEGEGFSKTKETSDFLSKYSATNKAPVELGGDPDSEANKKSIEGITKEEKVIEQQKVEQEQRKKAGSNIPKLVEDKKKAEKERDELKVKYEEFETKVKPELEKKITDLQSKIDSGDFSAKKEQEFQTKITELEGKLTEKEQSFFQEKTDLKKRLAFYDLSNDEDFQREYFEPVASAYKDSVSVIGGDKKKLEIFQRALAVNGMSLRAESEEEKSQAIKERRSLIAAIVEDMNDVEKADFLHSTSQYFKAAERHGVALKNHIQTAEQIKKKASEVRDRAIADRYETWNKTYEKIGSEYGQEYELTDDELKLTKELGIDLDEEVKKSDLIAKQTIQGKGQVTDAIRIVHDGRMLPRMKAKVKILEHTLKEKDALIAKLRSGSTGEGEGDIEIRKTLTKEEKDNKFLDKFRPGKR